MQLEVEQKSSAYIYVVLMQYLSLDLLQIKLKDSTIRYIVFMNNFALYGIC
jgi:hypothetical protein